MMEADVTKRDACKAIVAVCNLVWGDSSWMDQNGGYRCDMGTLLVVGELVRAQATVKGNIDRPDLITIGPVSTKPQNFAALAHPLHMDVLAMLGAAKWYKIMNTLAEDFGTALALLPRMHSPYWMRTMLLVWMYAPRECGRWAWCSPVASGEHCQDQPDSNRTRRHAQLSQCTVFLMACFGRNHLDSQNAFSNPLCGELASSLRRWADHYWDTFGILA